MAWPNTGPNIFYYPHHTADLSIAFQMNEASIISQFEWRSLIVGISRPHQPTITLMWANKCTYLIESLHLCLISAPVAPPSWECTARWMWFKVSRHQAARWRRGAAGGAGSDNLLCHKYLSHCTCCSAVLHSTVQPEVHSSAENKTRDFFEPGRLFYNLPCHIFFS